MRAVTVGQWFGVLQKDGPGSEQAVEYTGVDDPRFVAARNVKRAKLGLPLLPVPGATERGEDVAKDAELKQGQRVSTPHGVGVVSDRAEKDGGWMVKMVDGRVIFYPAHELYILPEVPKPA